MDSLNDISLRAATEDDIPTIVTLIHTAFKELTLRSAMLRGKVH
jgi:N-acetylglutamate synthase-like GNAT family acetyltransferase